MTFLEEAKTEAGALKGLIDFYSSDGSRALATAAHLFKANNCTGIIFAGMGASLCAPVAVLDYLAERGIQASSVTAYDAGRAVRRLGAPDLLVAIVSRSGTTKEALQLRSALGKDKSALVAIVNEAASSLALACPIALPMRAGIEKQIANKSYLCTAAVCALLAEAITGGEPSTMLAELTRLANWLPSIFATAPPREALAALRRCSHVDLLGIGPSLGTAYKTALVLREGGGLIAAALNCADYTHGWSKRACAQTVGIVLSNDYFEGSAEARAVDQLLSAGGTVILITASAVMSRERLVVLRHLSLRPEIAPLAQAAWCDAMAGTIVNTTGDML